ncbi:MAG TPA: hypothetical protein VMZ92_14725 [Planctomycetota bacterium]|nr:hypothetical protein [Planctomycetota bacterium]
MKTKTTRRGFFVQLGRAAGAAGLGAVVARLLMRPHGKDLPRRGPDLCRRCPVLTQCNFPEAGAVRRELATGREDRGVRLRDERTAADVRGLCGARPTDSPGSRWIRRETT